MKKQKIDKEECSSEERELESAELKKKKKKRKSDNDEIKSDSQLIPKKKRWSEEAFVGSTHETVESQLSEKKKSRSKDFEVSVDATFEPASTVKKKKRKTKEETCPDESDLVVADDFGIDSVSKKKKEKKSKKKEKGVDCVDKEKNSCVNDSDRTTSSAKKKKKPKNSKGSHSADDDEGGSRIDRAVDYLRKWQNDRKGWKFEKVKQMILLNSMYDVDKLPEADFEILLSYLDGLVGKGRVKTLEEAEKRLNVMDEAEKEDQNEEEYERIRKVIQVLS
ncbi:uncharacterized protein C7orf50 homolog [Lineus longissimus]|uniref:uncharacterized protein C7orf50 homolog n=1 Tax=Lineus longissimus TaxID=88925 RepID=UPI00315DB038